MKKYINILTILCVVLCSYGCKDDDSMHGQRTHFTPYKVAVILPSNMLERGKSISDWANSQIQNAQASLSKGVKLNIQWYDEDAPNLEQTIRQIVDSKEFVAIVGLYHSLNAEIAAKYCKGNPISLILHVASSSELQRLYSGMGFMWCLTEPDITQCEMLLSTAANAEAKEVTLLAKEDRYGQTFIDWFGFQAQELGLVVNKLNIYTDANLQEKVNEIGQSTCDYVICVPSNSDDVLAINKAINNFIKTNQKGFPQLLYSDVACSEETLNKMKAESTPMLLEGIAMSPDPSSGFSTAYELRYNEPPLVGEAQLFDAFLLLSYGLFKMQVTDSKNLNTSLSEVVKGRDKSVGSWMQADMSHYYEMLAMGLNPNICGATGSLDFDKKVLTSVTQSIYMHWELYMDKYVILNYLSCDGSKRTESNLAGWNWKSDKIQKFDENAKVKKYPELKDKWAVLIATSTGWANYRHQADVLAMYDLLRRHGYQDNHIILIMQDDIAFHPKNPEQGIIRVTPNGKDLYENTHVDYHLNDLSPMDLEYILSGQSSERLPFVISPTAQDDVFLFWSGHGGSNGYLNWGEYNTLRSYEAYQIFKNLGKKHQYRKMLCAIEACYSGGIAEACVDAPDVLFITAANPYETSKADVKSEKLGIFMSNGFTRGFQETIDNNSHICMRDLYYKLARSTVGSHVTIYNEKAYSNLYKSYMDDFLN